MKVVNIATREMIDKGVEAADEFLSQQYRIAAAADMPPDPVAMVQNATACIVQAAILRGMPIVGVLTAVGFSLGCTVGQATAEDTPENTRLQGESVVCIATSIEHGIKVAAEIVRSGKLP